MTRAPADAFASAIGALLFPESIHASDSASLARAERATPTALVVAFSGGRDSTVLLHLAWSYAAAQGLPLRAIHVNHQLQAAAGEFVHHCTQVCESLHVPLQVITVDVTRTDKGLEADARNARYAAFSASLQANELLLLGQHADDQLETLMLQLLRGAGPLGLACMPETASCGEGRLCRPLLNVRRDAISQLATERGWRWIDDPSNSDHRLARNRLRAELMPVLLSQRAGAADVLLRAVKWQAESAELLADLAKRDAHEVLHRNGLLSRSRLLELSPSRQANVLRWWLQQQNLSPPHADQLREFLHQLHTDSDRVVIAWAGQQIRVYADQIVLLPDWPAASLSELAWPAAHSSSISLQLPLQLGSLAWLATPNDHTLMVRAARADETVSIRWHTPGLRVALPNRAGRRELKDIFQAANVPAWLRPYWPKLFYNDSLIALPGLLVAADGVAECEEATGQLGAENLCYLAADGVLFMLAQQIRRRDVAHPSTAG